MGSPGALTVAAKMLSSTARSSEFFLICSFMGISAPASRSNAAPGWLTCSRIPSAIRTKTPAFDFASLLLKTTRSWQLPNLSFL